MLGVLPPSIFASNKIWFKIKTLSLGSPIGLRLVTELALLALLLYYDNDKLIFILVHTF